MNKSIYKSINQPISYRIPECQRELRIVVGVDAKLVAAAARPAAAVLALDDRRGDEGVGEVGAGGYSHQVAGGALLTVDSL